MSEWSVNSLAEKNNDRSKKAGFSSIVFGITEYHNHQDDVQ